MLSVNIAQSFFIFMPKLDVLCITTAYVRVCVTTI